MKRQWSDDNVISFSNEDLERVQTPYNYAVIVFMIIVNYDVKRVLVDNGNSIDILFYNTLVLMNLFKT